MPETFRSLPSVTLPEPVFNTKVPMVPFKEIAEARPLAALMISVEPAFTSNEPVPLNPPPIVSESPVISRMLPPVSVTVPPTIRLEPREAEFPDPTLMVRPFTICPPLAKLSEPDRPPVASTVRFEEAFPERLPEPLSVPLIVKLPPPKLSVPLLSCNAPVTSSVPPIDA